MQRQYQDTYEKTREMISMYDDAHIRFSLTAEKLFELFDLPFSETRMAKIGTDDEWTHLGHILLDFCAKYSELAYGCK